MQGSLIELLEEGYINVHLDNVTDGASLKIVDELAVRDVEEWSSLPAVDINPGQLDQGDTYRIRIETVLDIPAGVLPDASFHYDNVLLRANMVETPPADSDGDGIVDGDDNCIFIPNPAQTDTDGDGVGDLCDPTPTGPETDPDGDGVPTGQDNCPLNPNPDQADTDGDGAGDVCDPTPNGPDTDLDDDGVDNADDNCPAVQNPSSDRHGR